MPFVIGNIGNAGIYDPSSGVAEAIFTKLESIILDVDGKMTEQHAGAGMLPVIHISADRKPKVTLKGPELPLQIASNLLGANLKKALAGQPIQVPLIIEKTINNIGRVDLDAGIPISNYVTQLSVSRGKDHLVYNGVVAVPMDGAVELTGGSDSDVYPGQFILASPGDPNIRFSTDEAGTPVIVSYTYDSVYGGQMDILTGSIPGVFRFVANAVLINTANGSRLPISFIVYFCQFIGSWQINLERQKVSITNLDLNIIDPGSGLPAITIIPTANYS